MHLLLLPGQAHPGALEYRRTYSWAASGRGPGIGVKAGRLCARASARSPYSFYEVLNNVRSTTREDPLGQTFLANDNACVSRRRGSGHTAGSLTPGVPSSIRPANRRSKSLLLTVKSYHR